MSFTQKYFMIAFSVRKNIFLLLVILCLFFLQEYSCLSPLQNIFSLSLSRFARGRVKRPIINKLDNYGRIPQVERAIEALKHARTIIVATTNNQTIVFIEKQFNLSNPLIIAKNTNVSPLIPLIKDKIYLLQTGLSGDCLLVSQYMQSIIANYTIEYENQPSARYLSHKLQQYIRQYIDQNKRPLSVSSFLLTITSKDAIYHVDSYGQLDNILAGSAGKYTNKIMKQLEIKYHPNISIAELVEIYKLSSFDSSFLGLQETTNDKNYDIITIPHTTMS